MIPNLNCLLIDDDKDDQEIFKLALQDINEHIVCLTVDNGMEGLQLLRRNESFVPGHIFLDLNMPRMSGKDCLAALRSIPRLAEVPVVIYSTSSDPRDIRETKELGATDYIVKQYSLASLKEILRRYFN
ncbi:response regulator [Chitinophaga lutea]|uniref:Response regulator n=2 Tax=Chitinophaga lutea TaxID=2488634 RepID=A0A3N4QDT8_9BACT|nr:response regulator [Chitinophaga lutea]